MSELAGYINSKILFSCTLSNFFLLITLVDPVQVMTVDGRLIVVGAGFLQLILSQEPLNGIITRALSKDLIRPPI